MRTSANQPCLNARVQRPNSEENQPKNDSNNCGFRRLNAGVNENNLQWNVRHREVVLELVDYAAGPGARPANGVLVEPVGVEPEEGAFVEGDPVEGAAPRARAAAIQVEGEGDSEFIKRNAQNIDFHISKIKDLPSYEKFNILCQIYESYPRSPSSRDPNFSLDMINNYRILMGSLQHIYSKINMDTLKYTASEAEINVVWDGVIRYMKNASNHNQDMYKVIKNTVFKLSSKEDVSTCMSERLFYPYFSFKYKYSDNLFLLLFDFIFTLAIHVIGVILKFPGYISDKFSRSTISTLEVYATLNKIIQIEKNISFDNMKKIRSDIANQYHNAKKDKIFTSMSQATEILLDKLQDWEKKATKNQPKKDDFFNLLKKYLDEKRMIENKENTWSYQARKNNGKTLFITINNVIKAYNI